jgi:hypothetical protein
MARPEDLAAIIEGVDAWNKWVASNPKIKPDLTDADLSGRDLRAANLSDADLMRANLRGATLRATLLFGANLSGANLSNANLTGANLSRITWGSGKQEMMRWAEHKFRRPEEGPGIPFESLVEPYPAGANFSGASLKGADMTEAHLGYTMFIDTDLSDAKGLETCHHRGPSALDHRTVIRSRTLPLVFLRGCGLPDTLIDYFPSLLNQPIQFYSCFISYASENQEFAERLHADLQNKGVRCWFAPEDLRIGARTRPTIDETIRLHDKLLLILSRHSIASQWVEQEVETALEEERKAGGTVLFPIRLDDAVMECAAGWAAYVRKTRNIGDFTNWKDHDSYREAFDRLLRDLRAEESCTPTAAIVTEPLRSVD